MIVSFSIVGCPRNESFTTFINNRQVRGLVIVTYEDDSVPSEHWFWGRRAQMPCWTHMQHCLNECDVTWPPCNCTVWPAVYSLDSISPAQSLWQNVNKAEISLLRVGWTDELSQSRYTSRKSEGDNRVILLQNSSVPYMYLWQPYSQFWLKNVRSGVRD